MSAIRVTTGGQMFRSEPAVVATPTLLVIGSLLVAMLLAAVGVIVL